MSCEKLYSSDADVCLFAKLQRELVVQGRGADEHESDPAGGGEKSGGGGDARGDQGQDAEAEAAAGATPQEVHHRLRQPLRW